MLPSAAVRLFWSGVYYYYLNGIYYTARGSEYEVVDSPQDIVVSYLPEEAEEIVIDGTRYFIYDTTIYSVVVDPDGNKGFKVVAELED